MTNFQPNSWVVRLSMEMGRDLVHYDVDGVRHEWTAAQAFDWHREYHHYFTTEMVETPALTLWKMSGKWEEFSLTFTGPTIAEVKRERASRGLARACRKTKAASRPTLRI